MKHSTPRRRRPFARVAVILAALCLLGGLHAVSAPSSRVTADEGSAVREGADLFAVHCASCHGLNGEGSSQVPRRIGDSGSAAVDFQMATGRMPAAGLNQEPRRRTTFTQEQIDKIGAYVDSLPGDGPKAPGAEKYSTEGLTAEELARGGEIFRSNCAQCHAYGGGGGAMPNGKYAPSLVDVENKHIWEALRTGPRAMPQFNEEVMTDQDARELIGYLKDLHATPNKGGLGLGGLGPVAEGLWAWILGVGGLSLFAVWIAAKGARKE